MNVGLKSVYLPPNKVSEFGRYAVATMCNANNPDRISFWWKKRDDSQSFVKQAKLVRDELYAAHKAQSGFVALVQEIFFSGSSNPKPFIEMTSMSAIMFGHVFPAAGQALTQARNLKAELVVQDKHWHCHVGHGIWFPLVRTDFAYSPDEVGGKAFKWQSIYKRGVVASEWQQEGMARCAKRLSIPLNNG